MARPTRKGLSYFPLDVDIFFDDKMFLLQRRYGTVAMYIYVKLLCMIYRSDYYLEFDDPEQLAAYLKMGMPEDVPTDTVMKMLYYMIKLGLFDEYMFDEMQVITSEDIQKTYMKASNRKKRAELSTKYRLVSNNGTRLDAPVYENYVEEICGGEETENKDGAKQHDTA